MLLEIAQNHLKCPLVFRALFRNDLGTQNGPEMAPKSLPGASQDALGAQFLLDAASGPIFGRFSTPRNLEN